MTVGEMQINEEESDIIDVSTEEIQPLSIETPSTSRKRQLRRNVPRISSICLGSVFLFCFSALLLSYYLNYESG